MARVEAHDGLEVGAVCEADDERWCLHAAGTLEHLCYCNCDGHPCAARMWRVGDPERCAVCHDVADREADACR